MRAGTVDTQKVLGERVAGLHLFEGDLERDFQRARNRSRSRYFVPTALLGLGMFDVYSLVDLALAPQVLTLSLLLRLGVVTPLVLAGLLVRRRRLRAEPASGIDGPLVSAAAVLVVLAIAAIQYSAPAALGGAYFGGSFIVVVFFVTLLRSDVRRAAASLTAMLAAVAWGQALIGADAAATQVAALLAIAVSGMFGLVMAGSVESSERARFLAERRGRALDAEREDLIAALAEAAHRDEMTGLLNRRGLQQRLPAAGTSVGVLVLDVDHFKSYNDAFGHLEGDRCLTLVAETLAAHSRPGDVVARFGGEEFAVLLEGADREDVLAAGERLRAAVRDLARPHPSRPDGGDVVTVSVGVAVGPWESALAAADEAVYAAKSAGRDRVLGALR